MAVQPMDAPPHNHGGAYAAPRLHSSSAGVCVFLAFAGHPNSVRRGRGSRLGPAATPEAAVRLFYPWYLGEMMKGPRAAHRGAHAGTTSAEDTLRDHRVS